MVMVKRVLDAGAQTLMFPFVQNAEEAGARFPTRAIRRKACAALPPCTARAGRARSRTTTGRPPSELCVIVQIETLSALEQLPAIAAVPGDRLAVHRARGPGGIDGAPRQHHRTPDVLAKLKAGAQACRQRGKAGRHRGAESGCRRAVPRVRLHLGGDGLRHRHDGRPRAGVARQAARRRCERTAWPARSLLTTEVPGTANAEVTLAAGDATVDARARTSAARSPRFDWRGHDVLRPTPDAARAAGDVRQFACYPLVPYSNRIAQATLALGTGTHRLDAQLRRPPARDPRRRLAARLDARSARADARMPRRSITHPGRRSDAAWPFAFRATQAFALTPLPEGAMLTLTLTIRNTDARRVPVRPRLASVLPARRDDRARLRRRGRLGDRRHPVASDKRRTSPPEWRFDPPRAIGATTLDNVFTGWRRRRANPLAAAGRRAVIEADRACSHLVVFIPADRDYLAVEPVTHMTDAFNRAARGERDTGTRYLQPGEARSCTMRIVATTHDVS